MSRQLGSMPSRYQRNKVPTAKAWRLFRSRNRRHYAEFRTMPGIRFESPILNDCRASSSA